MDCLFSFFFIFSYSLGRTLEVLFSVFNFSDIFISRVFLGPAHPKIDLQSSGCTSEGMGTPISFFFVFLYVLGKSCENLKF